MGEASENMIDVESPSSSPRLLPKSTHPKVMLVPLVFIVFYEVSGGPFGIEDTVKAGGPMLAIAGFLIFPFLWSIPEALITVEMGTMFPENGGYVLWVTDAFGPFWGFQVGWWKWLSGVIDNALYPVLFLDYLKFLIPEVGAGPIRVVSVIIITVALTYMNYRGLTIVGWAATSLGIFSLLPFLVMAVLGLSHLKPARWLSVDWPSVKWTTYLNILFWNLNYWDSVSALVGEVDQPHKTLPRAMYLAVLLVVVGYLVPLLAGTGSVDVSLREKWKDGYFASIATTLGGRWLGWWMGAAAALSNMGMFEAEMSSDSFQLLGMAEQGMLPRVFASRSSHGTPSLGIVASAAGVLLLSWMSFQEIIAAENYLYCFGMLAEFAAFIWLRMHRPEKRRPYKIGLGTFGCACMCIPPTLLLILVMVIASWKVIIISFVTALIGFAMYPFLGFMKRKNWVDFAPLNPEFRKEDTRHGNEAAVGLLRDQK